MNSSASKGFWRPTGEIHPPSLYQQIVLWPLCYRGLAAQSGENLLFLIGNPRALSTRVLVSTCILVPWTCGPGVR